MKCLKKQITIPVILSLLLFPLLSGCNVNQDPVSKTGFYFDTVISITLYDQSKEALIDDAFQECDRYEHLLSRTLEGSDIWNINHSQGNPVTVAPETASLISTSLSYCDITNGAIDITLAPLSDLWNFSSDAPKHIPVDDAVKNCLKNVDYHAVTVSGNTVTLSNPNAAIDLGFIAKGYIADQLKTYLLAHGVTSGIINLGGNVLTIGDKPDHSTYQIGIQKPFDSRNTPIVTVPVSDSSMVSSGVYERYFEENGKLYHHILDPFTGYPYENHLLGVSILSHTSVEGDGLSTSCFVLGLDKGMELIESLDHVEALFITDDYELHYSSGFPQP
ncbi:MAG: FAD:protein FMN transferase [Lachnospiraceae bacterium]|nr:FAD:protein FMN transferase [Lachnospiraceae bacterium]